MSGQFDIINRIEIHTPYPNLDKFYGPYTDLQDAVTSVPSVLRQKGLTVAVYEGDGVVEYWWRNGIENSDLIPKLSSVSQDVDDERVERISSDQQLMSSITGETLSRVQSDELILTALSEEAQSRYDGDQQLNQLINVGSLQASTWFQSLTDRLNTLSSDVENQTYNQKNTFQSNFNVQLMNGLSFGKYPNGALVPAAGKTAVEVILDAAIQYLYPSFYSISISIPTTYEVGDELPRSVSVFFGLINEANVKPDSLVLMDGTNNAPLLSDQPVLSPVPLDVEGFKYTYAASHFWYIKLLNTNNEILNSNNIVIYWRYKVFHGGVESDNVSSSIVRALSYQQWDNVNSFTITVNTISYMLAIPVNKNLISIITSNNENITENFLLISPNETIYMKDNQTTKEYKVYVLTTAQVLGISAVVTLS